MNTPFTLWQRHTETTVGNEPVSFNLLNFSARCPRTIAVRSKSDSPFKLLHKGKRVGTLSCTKGIWHVTSVAGTAFKARNDAELARAVVQVVNLLREKPDKRTA